MNADGTEPTRLTMEWDHPDHGRPMGGEQNPSWSPNGAKIVFGTQRHGNADHTIYVINADGTGESRLMDSSNCGQWSCNETELPAWSPDGAKIAFGSSNQIYVMNADGSNATHLTSGVRPSWSPTGDRIVFEHGGIYVMNADGSNVTRIIGNDPGDNMMPAWGS